MWRHDNVRIPSQIVFGLKCWGVLILCLFLFCFRLSLLLATLLGWLCCCGESWFMFSSSLSFVDRVCVCVRVHYANRSFFSSLVANLTFHLYSIKYFFSFTTTTGVFIHLLFLWFCAIVEVFHSFVGCAIICAEYSLFLSTSSIYIHIEWISYFWLLFSAKWRLLVRFRLLKIVEFN